MATIVNEDKLSSLDSRFREQARRILKEIPQTISKDGKTFNVRVIVVSTFRDPERNSKAHGAKKSRHLFGLAVDYKFELNGVTVSFAPGQYGQYKKGTTCTVQGTSFNCHELWSIVKQSPSFAGCKWGGEFNKLYDPVHFQSSLPINGDTGDDESNENIQEEQLDVLELLANFNPSGSYTEGAGESSKLNSESPIADYSKTLLYIGYNLTLSEISPLVVGNKPITDLLDRANVDKKIASKLASLVAISGKEAYDKSISPEISSIKITQENALSILQIQTQNLVDYLNNNGYSLEKYPTEVSTAIVSYFTGKNMSSPEVVKDVDAILKIVSSKSGYSTLALFIEKRSDGLPSDVKARRMNEVELIKSYPRASEENNNQLTSTSDDAKFSKDAEKEYQKQLDNVRSMFDPKADPNSPASDSYDNSFNDISQEEVNAIAGIMQAQQTGVDTFFGYKENEYRYRVKTKNLYTTLSRVLNKKISAIDSIVSDDSIFKDHSEYRLNKMYAMIPYSSSLGYNVKRNAVKRCEYRIAVLSQTIRNHEMKLTGMGVPNTTAMDNTDMVEFLAKLVFRLSYNAYATFFNELNGLFGPLKVYREQLKLEQGNLSNLKHDMNRYL